MALFEIIWKYTLTFRSLHIDLVKLSGRLRIGSRSFRNLINEQIFVLRHGPHRKLSVGMGFLLFKLMDFQGFMIFVYIYVFIRQSMIYN